MNIRKFIEHIVTYDLGWVQLTFYLADAAALDAMIGTHCLELTSPLVMGRRKDSSSTQTDCDCFRERPIEMSRYKYQAEQRYFLERRWL